MWMVSAAAAERLNAQVQQSTSGSVPASDAAGGLVTDDSLAANPSPEQAVPMELLERTLILQPITGAIPGLSESPESLPGVLP
jgi:hypothetical protein